MSVDLRGLSTIAGYRTAGVLPWEPPQGVAYEAVAPNGRQVDLLVVPGEGPNFASRFLAEAEALRDAEQEHLPRVLDLGEADECLYFATAQARGDSLRQLLEEEGSLSPMRAVRLLGDAADALDAAHAAGVLHRALSPSSVLIRERPLHDTLLRGFALGLSPADPRPGQDQGPYVSPEEARGEPAMRASDIYSFACILLECFTGSPPANGELPAGLPAGLEEPLARGLSQRVVDRPRTPAQLVADAAPAGMAAAGGGAPA